MNIGKKHFIKNSQTFLKQNLEYLASLDDRLMRLLIKELDNGNLICDVSRGWPSKDTTMVQLVYMLDVDQALENGVVYHHRNDPHYWMHEMCIVEGESPESNDLMISGNRSKPQS